MENYYRAEDGKTFKTEQECLNYEKLLKKINGVSFYSTSNYEDEEEKDISDSVWETIAKGDYDETINKIFFFGECAYIAFKDKKALREFIDLSEKYFDINLSQYMTIDNSIYYNENEKIIFYCLSLFSDFFSNDYEIFFVDKKTLFNEVKKVMEQMTKATERIFKNL